MALQSGGRSSVFVQSGPGGGGVGSFRAGPGGSGNFGQTISGLLSSALSQFNFAKKHPGDAPVLEPFVPQGVDPITAALQAGAGMNPTAGRMRVRSRLGRLV